VKGLGIYVKGVIIEGVIQQMVDLEQMQKLERGYL